MVSITELEVRYLLWQRDWTYCDDPQRRHVLRLLIKQIVTMDMLSSFHAGRSPLSCVHLGRRLSGIFLRFNHLRSNSCAVADLGGADCGPVLQGTNRTDDEE